MKTTLFFLTSICCWFMVNGSLTVTGSSKVKKNENDIVVSCQVTSQSPAITFVYFINLFMNSSTASANSDYVEIATYGAASPSGKLLNTMASRNSIVLTGSTNVPTSGSPAYLTMTIPKTDIRCTDAAMYKCGASVVTNTGTSSLSSDKVVTVEIEVSPNSINPLNLSPFGTAVDNQQNTYRYTVGSVVTVSCTSKVGRPATNHRWCKKGPNDQQWMGFPSNDVIDQRTPLYNPSTCDYTRTSTLTFNVTAQDTKTDIMCEPEDGKSFVCASSTYQAQVTLLNDYTSSTNTGGQTEDDKSTSNAGVIAGATIGVIAGIILIAIIIYFVAVRGRNAGESYRTEEDGSPGGPVQKEGPVYSVPEKKGTNKGRYAHENKGLDEPHETRLPRHSPDRNNSHTNKAMYDEVEEYDNDRDGNVTPERSGGYPAEGFGSAV